MEESHHTSDTTHMAVLDHARAMVIYASELRMKNFNFFLVIMGVVVAAYVNVGRVNVRWVLGAVGVLVSVAFFLLDIRGRELLDAAKKELSLKELELGISIQATILQSRTGKPIKKIVSHTFVYRAIYILGLILSFGLIVFANKEM
jgi:hypothetical protein